MEICENNSHLDSKSIFLSPEYKSVMTSDDIHFSKLIRLFRFRAVCLTTGPYPFPKRVLNTVRYGASSFNFQYPHVR
jgi:hypothetical protein